MEAGPPDYDVIIAGAGIAGLTAASQLLDAWHLMRVIIVEPRNRTGGPRAHAHQTSGDELGFPVDLVSHMLYRGTCAATAIISLCPITTCLL